MYGRDQYINLILYIIIHNTKSLKSKIALSSKLYYELRTEKNVEVCSYVAM